VIKAFTLISRRSGLDHAAFRAYWRDVHAGVVMSLMETRPLRYVQNHFDAPAGIYPAVPATDGVAESWRASIADLPKPLHENPRWLEVVRPDELRFVDVARTGNIVAEEAVAIDGPATRWKLLCFLADEEKPGWRNAVRHVVNTPLPGRQRMLDGTEPPLLFSSIEELWFADRPALEDALASMSGLPGRASAVRVHEHVVHDRLAAPGGAVR